MKLTFDNRFARLGDRFSVSMAPRPLPNPHRVSINQTAADLIGLTADDLMSEEALLFFSGTEMIDGAEPCAMVYAGHQFGGFSPQLGDGRGLLLGQIRGKMREQDNILWDLHLKGAGQTPFCRGADGRAVLRSSIREYLASEALHHLGIPTSRALALIGSDEPVRRERMETAAGLIRLSESHIRFGSFEYFFYTDQHDALKILADYVLDIHYPQFRDDPAPYDRMLLEIAGRTAEMIARWQAFGFAHGVMNTDNMSILGQTFDYGPYGFMEAFNPDYICNHSDDMGRYAFNRQPDIGLWNCTALAHALSPLITPGTGELMQGHYRTRYFTLYDSLMKGKLGLEQVGDGDRELINGLLALMTQHKTDYTNFFRKFSEGERLPAFADWYDQYEARLGQESASPDERRKRMRAANPKYILRNYLAQIAIEQAEQGDFSEVDKLLDILRRPFDDQPAHEAYAAEPPDWGRHLDISCSS